MKSNTNLYYIGLDHVRAIAAYLVFCWHFLHASNGQPVPFSEPHLIPPISLLNEGHIGVSVFMTLSGYLFSKLLDNREVNYLLFYVNRFLRLAPLVFLVVGINAFMLHDSLGEQFWYFFASLTNGLIYPSLPNAGWSITVEFHFYLALPLLLWLYKFGYRYLVYSVILAISFRAYLFLLEGSVQYYSYWTIIGRLDLFLIGMLCFRFREKIWAYNSLASGVSLLFLIALYAYLNQIGGYKATSDSSIWIILATMEGVAIGPLIAFYDKASSKYSGTFSKFIANIGKYSYSIYLLHLFVVFKLASFIHSEIIDLSNIYLALIAATFSFLLFIPIASISFHLIEKPFLKYRVHYLRDSNKNVV